MERVRSNTLAPWRGMLNWRPDYFWTRFRTLALLGPSAGYPDNPAEEENPKAASVGAHSAFDVPHRHSRRFQHVRSENGARNLPSSSRDQTGILRVGVRPLFRR